jgi:putative transposase
MTSPGRYCTRLKRMQYRPDLLDGFITETGLITTPP